MKYSLSNGRGDIVAQADQSAALTWTASYEAYGRRTTETGSNADKQRGNSKDEDPTGLLNEGFRYRDLETGVWLSRDPAGFVDGPNVYAYVMQNPWTHWDPHGLATVLTDLQNGKKSVGQLNIVGKKNLVNVTQFARQPVTVCLFDGGETRPQTATTAGKSTLLMTARTYASVDGGLGSLIIDISKPTWKNELKKMKKYLEKHGGIDRIMVVDHGSGGYQEFGKHGSRLEPDSGDWKEIVSSVKKSGDIVLMGCQVAAKEFSHRENHLATTGGSEISIPSKK